MFVGEKEEKWRTKKEPSKEKIREGKEEGGGQGKKKSSFLASSESPVPKLPRCQDPREIVNLNGINTRHSSRLRHSNFPFTGGLRSSNLTF